jgi:hypothetical protein
VQFFFTVYTTASGGAIESVAQLQYYLLYFLIHDNILALVTAEVFCKRWSTQLEARLANYAPPHG